MSTFVAGIDEAGRGALLGPLVMGGSLRTLITTKSQKAIVLVPSEVEGKFIEIGVRDSKILSPKKREALFQILTSNPQIKWAVKKITSEEIDNNKKIGDNLNNLEKRAAEELVSQICSLE
jgi:ribonuclease HII